MTGSRSVLSRDLLRDRAWRARCGVRRGADGDAAGSRCVAAGVAATWRPASARASAGPSQPCRGLGGRRRDAAQVELEPIDVQRRLHARASFPRRPATHRGRTGRGCWRGRACRTRAAPQRMTAGIVSVRGAPSAALCRQAWNTIARMCPPASAKRCARKSRSSALASTPGGITPAPDAQPLGRARQRELDDEAQPAQERLVEVLLAVGGEDREALEALHALEQVADLEVGVAVVRVLDLGALAEQRVGLVEEQDHVGRVGGVEQPAQVLLGLADVLVDDLRQVDAVQRQRQCLARSPRRPSSCRCRAARRTAPPARLRSRPARCPTRSARA